MNDDWPRHLARTLVSGRATATLEQQLDALLIWLGNPDNPNVAVLDEAIAGTGLTRLEAAGRAYDILDRFLFAVPNGSPEQILGLRDTADLAAAKLRYRCLIQAYHPDRHPARVLVHNERTEQINIAYAAFERGVRESASRGAAAPHPGSTRKTPRARRRRPPKQVDPYPLGAAPSRQVFGARLRRWLGGAESFQARFFVGLILLCALLLASLLYPEPAPQRLLARLDVPALPASEARFDGVERAQAPSDAAELRLVARPTAIAPVQTPPRLLAVSPPSLLGQSRSEAASLPDVPALPVRIAPIPPVQAIEHAPALTRSSDSSTDPSIAPSIAEFDATMHASAATPVIPPVAMTKTAEDPTGLAATERARRISPPASAAAPASARANASPDAPVQPLRNRPPSVDETSIKAAAKTSPAADTSKGAPSPPGRSFSPAPESSKAVGCEPIAGALDRFRRAYNQGSLEILMALYSPDAQENETRGWSGIRRLYLRWFDETSDRRITFSGIRIVPEGKKRCGARAGFSVSYRDTQGRSVERTGTIAILFDGRGEDARIVRISY
ncbi:hypothetical protein [Thiocapsa rosea]|uniref:J domain-containing protein n=1 Tax=Thiocapsa rosea TaxID=69360 RepID=A0A495VBS1_9GAMM|nr:hypothetical protein [Thiocapsa rosea]RKT45278.1 hypothetical protein BDD21_2714 [Thiocapsa rosea]